MGNIVISNTWAKSRGFKKPFYYQIGVGALDEEQLLQEINQDQGQVVLVRRLDMGDLLKLDIAEEMDFMSKAVMTEEKVAAESDVPQDAQSAVAAAVKQSKNFSKMEKMINLVVGAGVLEPKLYDPPLHEAARQQGLMYIDEVPWNDRMELFSVVFEMDGIATFREEEKPAVGDVADDASVSLPAERPVDVRPSDAEGVLLQ